MGLDRYKKTPCGFAFVEMERRRDALDAIAHLSGVKLDGRVIRCELDAGFKPGRQYGRGASGGQVRDDRRGGGDRGRRRSGGYNQPNSNEMQQRWQAPERNVGDADRVGVDGHYGPRSGDKRERDDDGGNGYDDAKKARFDGSNES